MVRTGSAHGGRGVWSCAQIFAGEEALKLGLVTRLADEPLAAALDLAREIASKSPDAAAAAKRLLHATYSEGCDEARARAVWIERTRASTAAAAAA
jgi:enoyl-CoA hydratase/carnithine racemase